MFRPSAHKLSALWTKTRWEILKVKTTYGKYITEGATLLLQLEAGLNQKERKNIRLVLFIPLHIRLVIFRNNWGITETFPSRGRMDTQKCLVGRARTRSRRLSAISICFIKPVFLWFRIRAAFIGSHFSIWSRSFSRFWKNRKWTLFVWLVFCFFISPRLKKKYLN